MKMLGNLSCGSYQDVVNLDMFGLSEHVENGSSNITGLETGVSGVSLLCQLSTAGHDFRKLCLYEAR